MIHDATAPRRDESPGPPDWSARALPTREAVPQEMLQRVLVIAREPALRLALPAQLRQQGLRAGAVDNGIDALRAVDAVPPDLVVLDLDLQSPSGHRILDLLRRDPGTSHTPVLAVAESGFEAIHEYRWRAEAPPEAIMTKPVLPERVVEEVHRVLDQIAARSIPQAA